MKLNTTIIMAAALLISASLFAQKKIAKSIPANLRTITIAGIVVDAATMQPIEKAEIDDAKGHNFGYTDKKGYYNITFEYRGTGEVKFDLRVKKSGYQTFTQKEHWGDLPDGMCGFFYFGLQKPAYIVKSFSSVGKTTTDKQSLAYNAVLNSFTKVRDERSFANDIERAKHGNDKVFVQANGKYYVVNDSGWIPVASDKDLVSIDNKKLIQAGQLNSLLKRKKIRSMSTVAAADHKVIVYTVNASKRKK